MNYLSLYVHIPFCMQRCGYCDFTTFAGKDSLIPAYMDALEKEIILLGEKSAALGIVHTVYFGGGTPTLVPPKYYQKILNTIHQFYDTSAVVEISIEANPGTVDFPQLCRMNSYGINRISLGAQSFTEDDLKLLGRIHNPDEIRIAFQKAREAGFSNINLDLIFGLPNQSLEAWEHNLLEAIKLQPEHLSLYGLSIEDNTLLSRAISTGLIERPDPDLAADMYVWASTILSKLAYEQYEISNWSKKSHPAARYQCKHNLQYWHNQSYLGFGVAAHSYYEHLRIVNACEIEEYIHVMEKANSLVESCSPAFVERQALSRWDEMEETMMVGLRLTKEGIDNLKYKDRFNKTIDDCFHPQIEALIGEGLLEWKGRNHQVLRLTTRGRLLGNRVFREFIGNKALVE